MQEQEKELFEGYEIKNWNYSPRLYKILGAAAACNLFALLVIAQTNLLTKKGCDSPLVNRVCQVLDTVYVGSILLGTDTEFASHDYQKTELEDADITFIDVGNEKPFTYPEGYFPPPTDDLAMLGTPEFSTSGFSSNPIPGISMTPTFPPPSSSGTDLLNTPQNLPPPNNNPIIGAMPTSPIGANPISPAPKTRGTITRRPTKKNLPNASPQLLPDFGGGETAENKDKPDAPPTGGTPDLDSETVKAIDINKEPLQRLAVGVAEQLTKKEVDLNSKFLVQMEGVIKKDGRLDVTPDKKTKQPKSRYTRLEGDEKMVSVAQTAIEAIGDSGWLGYLRNLGVEKVNFTLIQDDNQITAVITSDQPTEERARTVSSGINGLIVGAKLTTKGDDEKALLGGATVTSQGKSFVLNFAIPKPVAQEMIYRKLQEAAAKQKAEENKPNSTAQTDNANLKTGK